MPRLNCLAAATALILACGPPASTGGGGERRTSNAGGAGSSADAGPPVHDGACDTAGFQVGLGQARLGQAERRAPRELRYRAQGSDETYDVLVFKTTLRPDEDTLAVGRYALPEAVEGNDAELLLRAYRGCRNVEGSDACDQTYQANGGTLSVDHSGSVGARFAARLENVTFIEMQSDGSGPGGQQRSFCGSPLRLEATLLEPPAPPVLGNCLGEGEGSAKGDRLRDLVLPNCYGDLVALHDNCGQVKAQIIVLTAGWCAACRARLPQTETLVQQYKDQGQKVEAYYVLGQGTSRNAPVTQQECRNDAEGKGIDPARMLMDTDGDRTGFYETKHQGWADACDNGTPYYFVLDGDDMSYNFGSRCEDDPRAQQGYTVAIEELLAP